jgi:hypothetical protein
MLARLLLLAALLAPGALAQFTVGGTMVHGGTGVPLAKARVFLEPASGSGAARATISAANGVFRFENVPAGAYWLVAERLGFERQAFAQRGLGSPYSSDVVVGEGQPTELLVFRMIPGAALSGLVRDARGEPAPDLEVMALRIMGTGANRRAGRSWLGRTDDRGRYRIAGLPAGSYAVAVYPRAWALAEARDVGDSYYPATFYPGVTGPEDAGAVRVGAGQEASADIALRGVRASSVYMLLRSEVFKNSQVTVRLAVAGPFGGVIPVGQTVYSGSRAASLISMDQDEYGRGVAAVSGGQDMPAVISVARMPAGSYLLEVQDGPDSPIARLPAQNASAQFSARPSSESAPELTLFPKVAATVRLSSAPAASPAGLTLTLTQVDGPWTDSAVADAAGRAVFHAAPPGRYTLSVSRQHQLAVVSLAAKGARVASGVITLPETGAVELEASAIPPGNDLTGHVYRGGRLEAAALVLLAPRADLANIAAYRFAQTDTAGGFTWYGVAPGDYLMFPLETGDPENYQFPEALKPLLPKAQPVTVAEPKQPVRLELPPR